jgi:hypothetical protein
MRHRLLDLLSSHVPQRTGEGDHPPKSGWGRKGKARAATLRVPGALVALGLTLLAGSAAAQVPLVPAQPDPNDPDATLVEELVVTARLPGPAWWRVSKGDSVVYVLGAPGLAPKRLAWDRAVFERRLEGANAVILPFKGLKVKLTGAPGALFAYMRLKSSTPFEETLPPGLRARFAAVRERLGEPAKHYGTKNPLAAGVMLISDYRQKAQLTDAEPTKLVRYLAQAKKVPVEQRTYDLAPRPGPWATCAGRWPGSAATSGA